MKASIWQTLNKPTHMCNDFTYNMRGKTNLLAHKRGWTFRTIYPSNESKADLKWKRKKDPSDELIENEKKKRKKWRPGAIVIIQHLWWPISRTFEENWKALTSARCKRWLAASNFIANTPEIGHPVRKLTASFHQLVANYDHPIASTTSTFILAAASTSRP